MKWIATFVCIVLFTVMHARWNPDTKDPGLTELQFTSAASCDTVLPDTVSAMICQGEPVMISPGAGFECYIWSTGETSENIFVIEPGYYSVTVCYQDSCEEEILYNVGLTQVEISEFSGFCEGELPVISATPGFESYLWHTGETSQTIYGPAETGLYTYYVTATDAEGCVVSDSADVEILMYSLPAISITDLPTCPGAPLPSGIENPPIELTWTLNGMPVDTISVTGEYCFTILDLQTGCSGPGKCVAVEVEEGPPLIIDGPPVICEESTGTICASPFFSSYSWSTGAATPCIIVDAGGVYCVTVTSSEGCTSSDCFQVEESDPIMVEIVGETQYCDGDTGMICFIWDTGSDCIEVYHSGIYSISLTDEHGCVNIEDVEVVYSPPVTVSDTHIQDDTGQGNGSVSVAFDSTNLPVSLQWNTGDTTDSISGLSAGLYTLSATDSFDCTYHFTFEVQMASSVSNNTKEYNYITVAGNPTKTDWIVSKNRDTVGGMLQYILRSVDGRAMWNDRSGVNSITIPAGSLHAGVYYLQVLADDQVVQVLPLIKF